MATTKPTKPSITLPSAFGTSPSNVKTPYTAQELVDGYSASIQQILDGGNVNWLNDTFFKFLTYTTAICDWLNGTPAKKIPFINSSNQLDYMGAPSGNIIGQIISCDCTSSYVPDGCLPCDGQEYAKSQFSDLWTNFLTSSPAKLNVCTYEQYQSDISTYGQCGKFAIDNENETFKVPTIKDGAYLTQAKSDSELGKAYNESLPNINGDPNWKDDDNNDSYLRSLNPTGAFVTKTITGKWINSASVSSGTKTTAVFNASSSSPVYQDNAPVQGNNIRVRYFIVVSTGQLNQAQMDWSAWASSLAGKMDKNASNITAQAKATISGWGMPSSRYIDLTLGATGSEYTAPANGFVYIKKQSGTTNSFFSLVNKEKRIGTSGVGTKTGNSLHLFIPVSKNDVFAVNYDTTGATDYFRFIYAEGEQNV